MFCHHLFGVDAVAGVWLQFDLQRWRDCADGVGGLQKIFFRGVSQSALVGDIPETVYAMFQLTFAIITPALIVGGFAERMKF